MNVQKYDFFPLLLSSADEQNFFIQLYNEAPESCGDTAE